MKTVEYLDALKSKRDIPSDYALANLLGTSRQSVSHWRSGSSLPDPIFAARIGEELGIDPLVVIADVESEKYIKRHHPHNAEAWQALIKRLGGVAAAVLLGTVIASPSPSAARAVAQVIGEPVYIMSTHMDANNPLRSLPCVASSLSSC